MKILKSPIVDLELSRLALCFGLVLVVAFILRAWRSSSEKDIYIASLRMTAQLALAAFLLAFLFNLNRAVWIFATVVLMWLIASFVALRPLRRLKGVLFPFSAFSLAVGSGITLFVITRWVVGYEPWYNPRYFLPLAGMLFANGMNGISLAAERTSSEMAHRRDVIRRAIDEGKTPWKAALPSLRQAYQAALLPTINSMLVVGVVAFPGMMTGQILSGTPPLIAVKYQLMVMCMLLSSIGISTPIYLRLAYQHHMKAAGQA